MKVFGKTIKRMVQVDLIGLKLVTNMMANGKIIKEMDM